MKYAIALAFAGILVVGLNAYSRPAPHADPANATRACIPEAGHATSLSVSSSAGTGELSPMQVYSMICTVDVYWEMGDSANPTADSNSNYLPKNAMMYFSTGGSKSSAYLSAVDVGAAAGNCYVTKCL